MTDKEILHAYGRGTTDLLRKNSPKSFSERWDYAFGKSARLKKLAVLTERDSGTQLRMFESVWDGTPSVSVHSVHYEKMVLENLKANTPFMAYAAKSPLPTTATGVVQLFMYKK